MDSPSPRSAELTRFNENDESNNTLASVWNSCRPLYRVLSVLVISLLLAALAFSSLPLWSPMGALMLHKLWDVLRFLVLTTSIGLGILNSGLWRGTSDEADSVTSSAGKEDSFSSKMPFAGMFYGEAQHSYSFSDKETGASEHGSMYRRESETRDVGPAADVAASTDGERDARLKGGHDATAATFRDGCHGNEASLRAHDDHQPYMQPATSAVPTRRAGIAYERDGIQANDFHRYKGEIDGAANEEVLANPVTPMSHNSENVVSRGNRRLVKPYDDLGLAAVAQQPKQSRQSKIIHRRGNSLELPITKGGSASILENCTATNHQISAPQSKVLSSEKVVSSTNVKVPVHVTKKGSEPSGSSLDARRVEHVDGGVPGTASKHSRSQSAYNLDELLVQQRPRSKPSTSGQLSKRRNVSLSCDLDKEYANRGMPAWLSSLPSPPVPPFIRGYGSVENGERHADIAEGKEQDESSLRRAFTESLAPWRGVTSTVPVNVPTYTHKEATQSNKGPSTKPVEKQRENIPSCPSPTNTMGSPSPRELNKKVDAFIARFHERMRLQRLESLERLKQRGQH